MVLGNHQQRLDLGPSVRLHNQPCADGRVLSVHASRHDSRQGRARSRSSERPRPRLSPRTSRGESDPHTRLNPRRSFQSGFDQLPEEGPFDAPPLHATRSLRRESSPLVSRREGVVSPRAKAAAAAAAADMEPVLLGDDFGHDFGSQPARHAGAHSQARQFSACIAHPVHQLGFAISELFKCFGKANLLPDQAASIDMPHTEINQLHLQCSPCSSLPIL